MTEAPPAEPHGLPAVRFGEALRVWVRVALLSFGGPAGQIAVMHRILVEEKRWLPEGRFLHALNYCMLLPGPEAQQLATYVGWLLHGTRGGLVAGTLFILPGFLSILLLSVVYATYAGAGPVAAVFFGLKPAVIAIVVDALLRIGRRALRGPGAVAVAAVAFLAMFVGQVPFPLIVLGAAAAGLLLLRPSAALAEALPLPPRRGLLGRTLRTVAVWLVLWFLPVLPLVAMLGPRHVLVDLSLFFARVAVLTFGGAYAVLAYVAQQAVDAKGWLEPGEMLDGLGMAETTPGPLIQVVQFVGFLGAYRTPAPFSPLQAGILGSALTTWMTFAPCFLWILAFAPFVERLRRSRALAAALGAISAAVVGAIVHLAAWFALHVLFRAVHERHVAGLRLLVPDPASIDVAAALLAAAALVAVLRFRVGLPWTLGAAALAGLAIRLPEW